MRFQVISKLGQNTIYVQLCKPPHPLFGCELCSRTPCTRKVGVGTIILMAPKVPSEAIRKVKGKKTAMHAILSSGRSRRGTRGMAAVGENGITMNVNAGIPSSQFEKLCKTYCYLHNSTFRQITTKTNPTL